MFQVETNRGHQGSPWVPWGQPYPTEEAARAAFLDWYRSLTQPHTVCGYNCKIRVVEVRNERGN